MQLEEKNIFTQHIGFLSDFGSYAATSDPDNLFFPSSKVIVTIKKLGYKFPLMIPAHERSWYILLPEFIQEDKDSSPPETPIRLQKNGNGAPIDKVKDIMELKSEKIGENNSFPKIFNDVGEIGFAKGGIDLNPTKFNLQIKGEGVEFNIPFNPTENVILSCDSNKLRNAGDCTKLTPQQLETTPIEGLYPVIFNMTPVSNLPMLLGITGDDETESTVEAQDKSKSPEVSYEKSPVIKEPESELAEVRLIKLRKKFLYAYEI